MALPFTEDWTGTNGDAWNSTRWPTQASEGSSSTTIDIQGNEGRAKAGTAVDDFVSCVAHADTDIQDSAGQITISPVTGTHNQWVYVCLRSTGETTASNAGRPATAYYFRFKLGTTAQESEDFLYRRVSNSESSSLATLNGTNSNRNAGEKFHFKWEIEDSGSNVVLRWKMWDADASEPGSFDSYTDTAPSSLLGATGKLQLVFRNYASGKSVEGKVDAITYNDLNPTVTGSVGQVTETDAAQAITPYTQVTGSVGQVTETDTAQTITPVANVTGSLGQVTETDSAQSITPVTDVTGSVGQVTETDTAQTITPVTVVTGSVGQVTETDSAQTITPVTAVSASVGQATETDAAQTITPQTSSVVSVGQATETDAAQAFTAIAPISASVGQATETSTSQTITPRTALTVSVLTATETDSAMAVGFIQLVVPAAYDSNYISTVGILYRHAPSGRLRFVTGVKRGALQGVQDWDQCSPPIRFNVSELATAREYIELLAEPYSGDPATTIQAAVLSGVAGVYPYYL